VTGASGAGVTTLGRMLAQALAVPHHDTDDYYWQPTDPPFRKQREITERLRLMEEMFLPRSAWVLSGAVGEWATPTVPYFDLVVFVRTAAEVRSRRLLARESRRRRLSEKALSADPDFLGFHEWAMRYEAGDAPGRSLGRQERWLATLSIPVLRVDGGRPVDELVAQILARIRGDAA
jgi:adenylate kinase family enzyme